MYIAILNTYYAIYAVGETEKDVKRNIVKGYVNTYPRKETRSVENATFKALNEHFGIQIVEIKNGEYVSE